MIIGCQDLRPLIGDVESLGNDADDRAAHAVDVDRLATSERSPPNADCHKSCDSTDTFAPPAVASSPWKPGRPNSSLTPPSS